MNRRVVWLQILVAEGLHPFFDERVRDLMDFKLYLDISDDVKFAWKMQRDSQERGHSEESIKQSIESRKPDFDAYIDPQKKHADIILQVSPICAEVVRSDDPLTVCSLFSNCSMACIYWVYLRLSRQAGLYVLCASVCGSC